MATTIRSFAAIAAVLSASLGGSKVLNAQRVDLSTTEWDASLVGSTPTNISGIAPGNARVSESEDDRLPYQLTFGELRDKPCHLRIGFYHFEGYSDDAPEVGSSAGFAGASCDMSQFAQLPMGYNIWQQNDVGDLETLELPEGHAVTAIRICARRSNDRLKGVELRHARPTPQGLTSQGTVRFERRNCNEWMPDFISCPAGQVARGFRIHRDEVSIVGMGLQCAEVHFAPRRKTSGGPISVRPPPPPPPQLSLNRSPEHVTDISGDADERFEMTGGRHAVVESIEFRERNDRPCFLRVRFRTHRPDVARTDDTFDGCDGNSRSAKTVSIDHITSELRAVAGLRICQRRQNDRLKGVQVFGARITEGGVGHDQAITESDERTNCNEWQPTVSCPADRVATGVIVHFHRNVRAPNEIIGLSLRCARTDFS